MSAPWRFLPIWFQYHPDSIRCFIWPRSLSPSVSRWPTFRYRILPCLVVNHLSNTPAGPRYLEHDPQSMPYLPRSSTPSPRHRHRFVVEEQALVQPFAFECCCALVCIAPDSLTISVYFFVFANTVHAARIAPVPALIYWVRTRYV